MKEELIDFLLQVVVKTSQNYGDQKIVYPLLQDNLDKLNLNFVVLLRHWSKNYFARESLDKAEIVAAAIGNFGTLIGEFPQGNLANNLDIAIACFEVIEIIFTHKAFPKSWATSKLNLGNAYGKRIYGDPLENLEKALLSYQYALKVYTCEKFPIEWAETQTNWVTFYSKKIRATKSKTNTHEGLENLKSICNNASEIFKQNKLIEKWAIVKNTLASAYCDIPHPNRSDNLELAIDIYNEILNVLNPKSLFEQWANTQMNLGIAYSKRIKGEPQENLRLAVNACHNSLKFYTRDNYPFKYAVIQNNLGNAYRDQGLASDAIVSYWLALEIQTPTVYPDNSLIASRNLANTAFKYEYWDNAIKAYIIAIKAVETSRSWVKSESRRQKILENSIDIYHNIVKACINAGQIEKAFEYSERSRSKRLVDLMASYNLSQGEEIPPKVQELLQQYEELQRQIDQERQSHKSNNSRSETRAAWEERNQKIIFLETQKQQVWENLRREDPVLAGEIQINPLSLSEIQELLKDQSNTAILSFYTTNSDIHIFVVQQNQITLHTCTGQGLNMLQGWIRQNWLLPYRDEPKKWQTQISSIIRELAERLQISELISEHLQGIEELILVPHLLLHQIPFTALSIGEYQEYLGDKFLIRYTPSCQILEFCQQRDNVGTFNEISLQYGTVEDAEDNLPCARFEGEKLAQMYNILPENRLIGSSQATTNNYRKLAQQVQVLHSCHHAKSCLDSPLESQLKLADGSITLGQLMTPSWRLPQLVEVFLSCCETNLGIPSLTDDILTLATGFLCAGARSVVSTLWLVDDLATALFSIFYYQHRQQGKNRPEALQKAQIQLREFTKLDGTKIFQEVEAKEKELIANRKKYPSDSIEYEQWKLEYNMYTKLNRRIKEIEKSTQQFPFSDPYYWAAFICHGLR